MDLVNMTNQKMLYKLIELSLLRGFTFGLGYAPSILLKDGLIVVVDRNMERHFCATDELLFNHQLAQLVFGDENWGQDTIAEWWGPSVKNEDFYNVVPAWKYHLMQLAIIPGKDRVKYVWENQNV